MKKTALISFFPSRFLNAHKYLLVTVILLLYGQSMQAQHSHKKHYPSARAATPPDMDAWKMDSFFNAHAIDIRRASNHALYVEVYKWYNTCYRYGGNSSGGIDCSHFVNMLYEKIYGITLGPSAGAIYSQCKILKNGMSKAREGDIFFFKMSKGQISHVGIYLQNGKFAHASTHSGVIISDIEEPYYKKRFYKVGRVTWGAPTAEH